jgi:hypothetical protein
MGKMTMILGVNVVWGESEVTLSQESYIRDVIQRGNLEGMPSQSTPVPSR